MAKLRFDVQKLAVGGGVGLLSSYLAANDVDAIAKGKRANTWQKWENLGAVGVTGIGYAMQAFDMYPAIGESLSNAGAVLLGKVIGEEYLFKKRVGISNVAGGSGVQTYVQRVNELPVAGVSALSPTEIYDKIVRPRRGI